MELNVVRSNDEEHEENEATNSDEQSSVFRTAVNIAKICIGAGILALPYAFKSGGIAFSSAGVFIFAGWNYVTSDWLLQCKAFLGMPANERRGASSFATIARQGLGPWGEVLVDALIASVFFGVMSSYLIAVGQLAAQTELLGSHVRTLIWVCALAMTPFICVKNLTGLACTSAISLMVIFLGMACIINYGASLPHYEAEASASATVTEDGAVEASASASVGESWAGMATFTGIVTFSYGIQLMVLPLQESMKKPSKIRWAVAAGLFTAASVYWMVGLATVWVFQNTGVDLDQNVMLNLPEGKSLTMFVGVSVAVCITFSYPLSLFPLTDMMWHFFQTLFHVRSSYQELAGGLSDLQQSQGPKGFCRIVLMVILIFLSAACAAFIPFLGLVVSLLGNFSITLLGFVIPAVCYLRIGGDKISQSQKIFTIVLFVIGLFNCIFCTTSTIQSIVKQLKDLESS